MRHRASAWFGSLAAGLIGAWLCACGPPNPAPDGGDAMPRAMWPCPDGWVTTNSGGCGPAVLLCATSGTGSGGAASGACANVDITQGTVVNDENAMPVGRTLFRGSDGTIHGAWPEDGDPTGPPSADWTPDAGNGSSGDAWSPDAGIDTCPDGWTRLADRTCDAQIRDNCADGAGPLPGAGCTRTSAGDCPAGEYADPGAEAVGATIVHVRAGADPAVADGSVATPYATVNDAMSAAGSGAWILVAAGTYDEVVEVANDVHVLGVCPSRVTLSGTGTRGIVHASGASAHVDLRGMTLAGSNDGMRLEMGARGRIDRVVITGTARGVSVEDPGAHLDASDVYVHDLVPPMGRGEAYGFVVDFGATLTMSRGSIVRARGSGMFIFNGSAAATLSDTLIDAITRGTNAVVESCVTTFNVASLTAERCVFRNAPGAGLTGASEAQLTLTDCIVSNTHGTTTDPGLGLDLVSTRMNATRLLVRETEGTGIQTAEGQIELRDSVVEQSHAHPSDQIHTGYGIDHNDGSFVMQRVRITGSDNFGIANPGNASSTMSISDTIVERTHGFGSAPSAGIGIGVDGQATIERTLVRDSSPVGVIISSRASVTMRDSVVAESHAMPSIGAAGVAVAGGGHATMERVRIRDTEGALVVVQEPQSTLTLSDSVIGPSRSVIFAGEPFGAGIIVAEGAVASVSRVRVTHPAVFGVTLAQQNQTGTDAVLEDCVIQHQEPAVSGATGKLFGAGVSCSFGATVTVRRTRIEGSAPLGAFAYSGGSRATLRDVVLRDTDLGTEGTLASGLMAFSSGVIDGERVLIERSVDTGVTAVTRGEIHLRDTLLLDVARDSFGFGIGVSASGDGVITLDRTAVVATNGAALMATPYQDPQTPRLTGASLVGNDIYARNVGTSTLRIEYDEHDNPMAVGRSVAYAVHAGAMCSIDLTHAVLSRAGYGFYASSGSVGLHHVVIADMLDSAGALSGAMPVLEDVSFSGNVSNEILQSMDLPEGSMLQTPQAACATADCR